MRAYLDPHLYLYEADEWASHAFTARLQALVEALIRVKSFEDNSGAKSKLVNFRISNGEAEDVYLYNPFLNVPEIAQHYVNIFHNQIFPELIQRFIVCPSEQCDQVMEDELPRPILRAADDTIGRKFVDGRDVCRICQFREFALLLKHGDRASVAEGSPFFDLQIEITAALELVAIDPTHLFPDVNDTKEREVRLRHAIELERLHAALLDPAWLQTKITNFTILESFWTSLNYGQFGDLEYRYKRRILNSLLQVATGRSTTAYLHRMTSQSFTYRSVAVPRWNAYVFQSGASDQDRRCSRIYYGKHGDNLILETYDPNAH